MQLLFKQRLFSWFDSYDIYDENGNIIFVVQGKLSWGHRLEIYTANGEHLGTVKEEIFTFMPRFALYVGKNYMGCIRKELTLFKPVFSLDCNSWKVTGDLFQWDYKVADRNGNKVMQASKQLFHWTDTYTIDIVNQEDVLLSLMIVLAIDAAKCAND